MKENSGTRSSLLFEVKRLLNECTELPDVLLMENVPQVHNEQNKPDFDAWLDFLKSKGYFSFWKDLNAKDYGIPQNRDRCFCVSILSKEFIDFQFPEEIKLNTVMKDLLEKEVDEKYYINTPKADELIKKLIAEKKLPSEKSVGYMNYNKVDAVDCSIGKTLCARDYKGFGTGFDTMNGVIEPLGSETILMKNMIDKNKEVEAEQTDVATTLLARDYKGVSNFGSNGVVECVK